MGHIYPGGDERTIGGDGWRATMKMTWVAPRTSSNVRRLRFAGVVALVVGALVTPQESTQAASLVPTKFSVPGSAPTTITAGYDGALYFAQFESRMIGRITTTGTVTQYPLPSATDHAAVGEITATSDGALWLADCDAIWRAAPGPGTLTRYPIPSGACARGMTVGPDGNVWFTASSNVSPFGGHVGRITTSAPVGVVTEFPQLPEPLVPETITTGPDGALWFTADGNGIDGIGRMTTDGSVTGYPLPQPLTGGCPHGITTGSDGALWFTLGCRGTIGRLTTAGVFSEFPASDPLRTAYAITAGPDGALWYVLNNGDVGRMTTDGTAMQMPIPNSTGGGGQTGIVAGPGGIWFTGRDFSSGFPGGSGFIGHVSVSAITPSVTITTPPYGVSYSLYQVVNANFFCTGVQQCTGTVPSGSPIDTSIAGAHTFQVSILDNVGNPWTQSVSYTVLATQASATVTNGGFVTTDPGNLGATPAVPLQTSITAPSVVSGTLSVTPQTTTTVAPTGFVLFGTEMLLAGPAATEASPYQVTFTVDSTALNGVAPADVQVFRNGVALTDCSDPTAAVPDPCIVSRSSAPDGDALVTVRTSHFSTWSLGRLKYDLTGPFQPVDAAPTVNTAKAGSAIPVKFKLGGDKGLNVLADGYPKSGTASCASASTEIEQTVSSATSALTYDPVSTQYTYTWKTTTTLKGCRDLLLRFRDGSSQLRAMFNLR